MNKSQLIDTLAARFEGNRKQAAHALESVLDTITREVAKGEKVAITGFGSFEKRVRDARWVRNPRTGERIKAKKTAIPKFSAGADLKAVVSGAKKLPKLTARRCDGGRQGRDRHGEEGRRPRRRPPAQDRRGEEGHSHEDRGQEGAGQEGRCQEDHGHEDGGQEGRRPRRRRRRRRPPRRRRRPRRPPAKKTTAKKTAAKKAPAKKTTAKKTPAKKA